MYACYELLTYNKFNLISNARIKAGFTLQQSKLIKHLIIKQIVFWY